MKYVPNPSILIEAIQVEGPADLAHVNAWVSARVPGHDSTVRSMSGSSFAFWCTKSSASLTVPYGTWLIVEDDKTGVYPCVDSVFRQRWKLAPLDRQHENP